MSQFAEGGEVELRVKALQDKLAVAKDAGVDLIEFGKQNHLATLAVKDTFQFLILLAQVAESVVPEVQGEIEGYAMNLLQGLEDALSNFEEFGQTILSQEA